MRDPIKRKLSNDSYRLANRAKARRYNRLYRIANPHRIRESNWKRFGIINPDGSDFKWNDYVALLEQANHLCEICKESGPSNRSLSVDHNHDTGVARGVLCHECNTLLGQLEKAIKNRSLLQYLFQKGGRRGR